MNPATWSSTSHSGSWRGRGRYRRVFKLEPGHFLLVKDGRCVESSIGTPSRPTGRASPESDANARKLRATLDAAVSGSLVSDVPVSLMLSGGLDSSAIAALATQHDPPAISPPTRSRSGCHGRIGDRRPTRSAISASVTGRSFSPGSRWPKASTVARRHGSPFGESDLDSRLRASLRAVAGDGNKVLLGGDGADELFGGYNRWMTYLRFHDRYWRRIPGTAAGPIGRDATLRTWARRRHRASRARRRRAVRRQQAVSRRRSPSLPRACRA